MPNRYITVTQYMKNSGMEFPAKSLAVPVTVKEASNAPEAFTFYTHFFNYSIFNVQIA